MVSDKDIIIFPILKICFSPCDLLHKKPYKARFIANSSSCTTTELSKLLTSCLTAVKKHVIKYCEKVYERSGKNLFWSIKNSGEILDKLKARDFNATSLSTYDFSTLYTTLPHNLIKDKRIDLIERTFQREGSPYLACSDRNAFFTSEKPGGCHAWSCQNVCDALTFLLDNIFIRFGTRLCGQVVGIPVGTNFAPLVADLFLFCYEGDFMMSLSDDGQAGVVGAFNAASGCLGDILNINNVCFEGMVGQMCRSGLRLNKANASGAGAAFFDLHLSISNDIVSTKVCGRRDDFDFEIVGFPFLDGDVPRSTSYGVYISQLIRFARASSYVTDFNTRGGLFTRRLLRWGYRYHKLRKTFSKFCGRCCGLVSGFQVGLGSLLRRGLSEPGFCGGLVCGLGRVVGSGGFSAQFVGVVSRCGGGGWLWRWCIATDCVLGGPPGRDWRLWFPLWLRAGGSDFRLYDGSDLKTCLLVGWWGPGALAVCRALRGLPVGFLLLRCSVWFAVGSLSLLCLLVVSWFVCFGGWCVDGLGVFRANQVFMCLGPHLGWGWGWRL